MQVSQIATAISIVRFGFLPCFVLSMDMPIWPRRQCKDALAAVDNPDVLALPSHLWTEISEVVVSSLPLSVQSRLVRLRSSHSEGCWISSSMVHWRREFRPGM